MFKAKTLSVFLGLLSSILLAVSFSLLAGFDLDRQKVEFQLEDIVADSQIFATKIILPKESDYVLKLKYKSKATDREFVFLNGKKLELRVENTSESLIKTHYYYITKKITCEGENALKIEFYPVNPNKFDINLKNYIVSLAAGNMLLTIKNASLGDRNFLRVIFFIIVFFFLFFSLWLFILHLGTVLMGLPFEQSLTNAVVVFLPFTAFFLLLGHISFQGPYSLVFRPGFLFLISGIVIATNLVLNLFSAFLSMITDDTRINKKLRPAEPGGTESFIFEWSKQMFLWIENREFSEKCILLTFSLLIVNAFLLIFEMEIWAGKITDVVSVILVIGIIIKLVKFIRNGREN